MQVTHYQSNFTAGEFSPGLFGRVDLAKYNNACSTLENFLIQQQGGAVRRPGTRFVAAAKSADPTKATRVIPFQYNTVQTYTLEFGDGYVRFYSGGAQISVGTVTAWSNGTAYVLGDLASRLGVNYYCILAHTAHQPPNATYWYPLPSAAYEIPSPYTAAQVPDVKFTQSADILFLTHPAVRPMELRRLGSTNWQFIAHNLFDGPYLPENTTAITLTPAATTGSTINVTASAALFATTDVGRVIRIKDKVLWGWGTIVTFTSSTVVVVNITTDFDDTDATLEWRLGAFSSVLGYPAVATFHQERLWFASTSALPQTVWGSRSGDFGNFGPSRTAPAVPSLSIDASDVVSDDDGVTFTIDDDRVNTIRWMLSAAKGLIILTDGGEFLLRSTSTFDPITPTNVGVFRQSTIGAHPTARPTQISIGVLFFQTAGRKLFEFTYEFTNDQYIPQNMTLLAEHVTLPGDGIVGGVVDMAYQQEPSGIVWCVRADGALVAMTYQRDQEVVAWHRHPLGGDDVFVESVAVIRDAELSEDQVWLVVRRTVNGATVRYIEFLEQTFNASAGVETEDAFFVDCGLSYDGWNTDLTKTLAITGGTTYAAGDTGTLTAAGHTPFTAGMVGRIVRFRQAGVTPDGAWTGVQITGYTSTSIVSIAFIDAIPTGLQGVASAYWGLTATKVGGLDHLEGQTVKVLVDGATHPDAMVLTGYVSLDVEGAIVHVGLSYTSNLQTMPMLVQTPQGTSRSRAFRPLSAFLSLLDTLGGSAKALGGQAEEILYREVGMAMDEAPDLYTGFKQVSLSADSGLDSRVSVITSDPLPMTVLAIETVLDGGGMTV